MAAPVFLYVSETYRYKEKVTKTRDATSKENERAGHKEFMI